VLTFMNEPKSFHLPAREIVKTLCLHRTANANAFSWPGLQEKLWKANNGNSFSRVMAKSWWAQFTTVESFSLATNHTKNPL